MFQPGSYTIHGRTERLHLLDLSTGGGRAHAEMCPARDQWVDLTCVVSLGRAKVVWVRGHMFGLAFALALSDATVRSIIDFRPEKHPSA